MSFDLTASELDNHPIIRTMLNVHYAWSIGCSDDVWGPGALPTELCRFVVTMCNGMHKGSSALNAPVRG